MKVQYLLIYISICYIQGEDLKKRYKYDLKEILHPSNPDTILKLSKNKEMQIYLKDIVDDYPKLEEIYKRELEKHEKYSIINLNNGEYEEIPVTEEGVEAFIYFLVTSSLQETFELDILAQLYIIAEILNIETLQEALGEYLQSEKILDNLLTQTFQFIRGVKVLENEILEEKSKIMGLNISEMNALIRRMKKEAERKDLIYQKRVKYESGFHFNISKNELLHLGFEILYYKEYAHPTTDLELLNISTYNNIIEGENNPNSRYTICVGGEKSSTGVLSILACGPASLVLMQTAGDNFRSGNVKRGPGGVFWYFMPGRSFGFLGEETLDLSVTYADDGGVNSTYRLSWTLKGNIGGFRVQDHVRLYQSHEWNKVIFGLRDYDL